MNNFIILFFVLFVNSSYGQHSFIKEWDRSFGGTGWEGICALIQTDDGSFIFGGSSYSRLNGDLTEDNRDGAGVSSDYWIVKTDSLGNKLWDKRYGGTGWEYMRSIITTNDGGLMIGGFSNTDKNGDRSESSHGGFDYWIVKLDSSGNKIWDKRYGGTGSDDLSCIVQTSDGGYILGGDSDSDIGGDKSETCYGHQDYWVVKIDSIGNKQWDRRYGGGASDVFKSLVESSDGGYILAGYSYPGIGFDYDRISYGSSDYWLVKIDSVGNKQWVKNYGGSHFDFLNTIISTRDNSYLLAGYSMSEVSGNKTTPSQGNNDFWIIKIDSSGNIIWDKDFGGILQEQNLGSVIQTSDDGFLIIGLSSSDISGDKTENNLGEYQPWIIKTDAAGNLQWEKTLLVEGENQFSLGGFIVQTIDRCFVTLNAVNGGIGGYKTQPNWDTMDSTYDQWIVKFCDTSVFTLINSFPELLNDVSVYPNPFNSILNFSINKNGVKDLFITVNNVLGETIFKNKLFPIENMNELTLEFGDLKTGLYFLEVISDNEKLLFKIVKE